MSSPCNDWWQKSHFACGDGTAQPVCPGGHLTHTCNNKQDLLLRMHQEDQGMLQSLLSMPGPRCSAAHCRWPAMLC